MTKPHGYLVGILQTHCIDDITKTLQHMTTHNRSNNNDSEANAQWTRTRKYYNVRMYEIIVDVRIKNYLAGNINNNIIMISYSESIALRHKYHD